ncbi:MAG: hypothetical protein P8010_03535 [Desulfosarcinaceae bacterium]
MIVAIFVLFNSPGQFAVACMGIAVEDGKRVLVGNNEEWFNCVRRILAATHQEGGYPTLYSNTLKHPCEAGRRHECL